MSDDPVQSLSVPRDPSALEIFLRDLDADAPVGRLSPKDRGLCRRYFEAGLPALIDAGMSKSDIRTFLSRTSVRAELARLEDLLGRREEIDERSRFLARLGLVQLLPRSTDVMRRALMYDHEHEEAHTEPPSNQQLRVAERVFDLLRVAEPYKKTADDTEGETRVNVDARSIIFESSDSAPAPLEQRTRENVRMAMRMLDINPTKVPNRGLKEAAAPVSSEPSGEEEDRPRKLKKKHKKHHAVEPVES